MSPLEHSTTFASDSDIISTHQSIRNAKNSVCASKNNSTRHDSMRKNHMFNKESICFVDCELHVAKTERDIKLYKLQEARKQLERGHVMVKEMTYDSKESITIDGVSSRRGSYKNLMQKLSTSLLHEGRS